MHAAANAFDRLHRAQLELLSRFFMTSDLINIAKERCFGWHTSFNLANRGTATLTCSNTAFQFQSAHTHTQCSTLIAFLENGDRSGTWERQKKENCYLLFAQIVIKYLKIMPRAQEEICKKRKRKAEMREIFIFMRRVK